MVNAIPHQPHEIDPRVPRRAGRLDTSPALLPDFVALGTHLQEARLEELPRLIGRLEALKAAAWARISEAALQQVSSSVHDANLSVAEAAQRLGVSRDYLYRHASRLPFTVKIGRRVLFSTRGIETWLQQRRGR